MYINPSGVRNLGFDDFLEVVMSVAVMPWMYQLFQRNPEPTAHQIEREVERGLDVFGPVLDAVFAAPNKPKIEKNLWPMACLAASIAPRFEIRGEGKIEPPAPEIKEHVETGLRVFQATFEYMKRREKVQ